MLRLLFYLLLIYLIFKALKSIFGSSTELKKFSNKTRSENPDIIDIDYEEIKDDDSSSDK